MPKAKQESKTPMMIAVLLGIAGLLILLIFFVIRSQADESDTSADINNSAPTLITSFQLGTTPTGNEIFAHAGTSTLNLIEGTTTTIYANGSFQDLNGCEDVTEASIATESIPPYPFYRNNLSVVLGTDSKQNIYEYELGPTSTYYAREGSTPDNNGTGVCTFSNCDNALDVEADFLCTFDIQYFADNTTTDTPKGTGETAYWIADLRIRDNNSGSISAQETFEVNLLTAIDTGTTTNYGSVAVGERSATQTLQITNTGNDNTTDIDMIGTDMTCTEGTISVTQQRYATSSAYTGTFLTLASSTVFDTNVPKQVALYATSTLDTYWTVDALEASGGSLAGTCTGTNTLYGTAY